MYSERLLNAGERIRLLRHPHPVSVARPALAGSLLLLGALTATLFGGRLNHLDTAGVTGALLRLLGDEPQRTVGWLAPGLLLAGLLVYGLAWLQWRSTEYAVIAEPGGGRLLRVSGILGKRVIEAPLDKINDLVLHPEGTRPLLGRLLGYGEIQVKTGNDYSGQTLLFVPDPHNFYSVCRSLRSVITTRMPAPASSW